MKNIFLIGLPLCGKSKRGKMITKKLGIKFFDSDDEIEKKEEKKIKDIFDEHGENYFRELETETIKELSKEQGALISLGGGSVLRKENQAIIKKGIVVFIDKKIEDYRTVKDDKRPLLKNIEDIKKLREQRYDIYMALSDYVIDSKATAEKFFSIGRIIKPNCEFAVIGDPVSHSKSPMLQRREGIKNYKRIWVKEKTLPDFIEAFKKSNMKGFNVTVPHKMRIKKYIQEFSKEVEVVEAINTVIKKNGQLCGYNTDVLAIKKIIERRHLMFEGKNIFIIGDGGAGTAIKNFAEQKNAKNIWVANRKNWSFENIKNADIIFQTTPLGMKTFHEEFENLSFLKDVRKEAFIMDLVYNPLETKFVKKAKELKLDVINGMEMLEFQAKIASKIFKGEEYV